MRYFRILCALFLMTFALPCYAEVKQKLVILPIQVNGEHEDAQELAKNLTTFLQAKLSQDSTITLSSYKGEAKWLDDKTPITSARAIGEKAKEYATLALTGRIYPMQGKYLAVTVLVGSSISRYKTWNYKLATQRITLDDAASEQEIFQKLYSKIAEDIKLKAPLLQTPYDATPPAVQP